MMCCHHKKNWVGAIAPLLYNATHDNCFSTHKLGYEWLTIYIPKKNHLGYAVLCKTIWCKRWIDFVENEVPFEWFNIEWICIMQLELNSNIFNSIQISKLNWIEPNTIFFSFGFNMVSVLIEISIELNSNQIDFFHNFI
jgi:hypothetical protein